MSKPIEVTVRAKRGTKDADILAAAQHAADRIEAGLTLHEVGRAGESITFEGTPAKKPTPKKTPKKGHPQNNPEGETWPHPVPASLPTDTHTPAPTPTATDAENSANE